MVRRLAVFLLMTLALAMPLRAAAKPAPLIAIELETREAFLGDTVVIEVRWSGLDEPIDFSPLRQAATVVRETAGSRIAVVDGEVAEIASRRIELLPHALGRLQLGPLRAGDTVSNSVAIEIAEAKTVDWTPGREDIRLEQTVSRPDPWLQQEVVLDIALFTRHPIRDEKVVLPDLDGLRTVTVYKERRTLEESDGGWSKIAWRMLVFPQRSGTVAIAGTRISGAIDKSRAERARFDLAASATDLAVRPAAFAAAQWWVPASRLSLADRWSKDPRELRAGDEVERTITVSARDVLPEQIPDIAMDETRGLAITPLGVERTMKLNGERLEAQASRRFRIRAMSPVPVFLDTVRLRWWNTEDDRAAEAIIPARRIDIGIPDRDSLIDHALADAPWWRRLAEWLGAAAGLRPLLFSALAVAAVAGLAIGWRRRVGINAWLRARRTARRLGALARSGDGEGLYRLLRQVSTEPAARRALAPLQVELEAFLFGTGATPPPDFASLAKRAGHALRQASHRPAVSALPPL